MKHEFRAHPLMMLRLIKPFLFVLILPVMKGTVQYLLHGEVTGVFGMEIIAAVLIVTIAALRCFFFRIQCYEETLILESGLFFRVRSVIPISKLSSVQAIRDPLDAIFGAVTYQINTEAGRRNQADFEFKLSVAGSQALSHRLYGQEKQTEVHFSTIRVAAMAAATSSAVTGMLVAVPIINKAGKLLGLALNRLLFDEINQVSSKVPTAFPPIVNVITLVFLLAYGFSFFYSLLKYLHFELLLEEKKLEVRSGIFVRRRAAFLKDAVNAVTIDQTPIMRLFQRTVMKVSVGGYGNGKGSSAVLVPSGKRGEMRRLFTIFFPDLHISGNALRAKRDPKTLSRFLFWPRLYWLLLAVSGAVLALLFHEFARLILFLFLIGSVLVAYLFHLAIFEYRYGQVKIGDTFFLRSIKGFHSSEMICPKEKIGEIKLARFAPDFRFHTCNLTVTVRSEAADSLTVRHIGYEEVKKQLFETFGFEV